MDKNYFDYPCNNCIVKACCQKNCALYFQYINHTADHMGKMTADELYEFRINTPIEVRRVVEKFWKDKTRYRISRDLYTGDIFYAPVG